MFKLRSMMEDVAEKLFGRFLPQVKAQADDCQWKYGCCNGGSKFLSYQECDTEPYIRNVDCSGHCPT
jgi:hypothetical protein